MTEDNLEFQLERAQRSAYYAANYQRDHPGHNEALTGYQAASDRVQEIVAQMQRRDQRGREDSVDADL